MFSAETIRSHIIAMTTPPPMHQPEVAAMIGFSVVNPTVGIARHSSGRSVTSAPEVKARPGAAQDRDALIGGVERLECLCSSTATPCRSHSVFPGG